MHHYPQTMQTQEMGLMIHVFFCEKSSTRMDWEVAAL